MSEVIGKNEQQSPKNFYAWIILLLPAVYVGIDACLPDSRNSDLVLILGATLISIFLIKRDIYELSLVGYDEDDMPSYWWIILLPGYFFARPAKLLGKRWAGSLISIVLWGIVAAVSINQEINNELDESACNVTTRVLHEQFHVNRVCKAIVDKEKLSADFYTAKAVLDNGARVTISIEMRADNNIYVTVNRQ